MRSEDRRARAALAIASAAELGDAEAARKFGMSVRAIQRWRRALKGDSSLSAAVAEKRAEAFKPWAELYQSARATLVAELVRHATACPISPESIHAIAGALKILGERDDAGRMLDAELQFPGKTMDRTAASQGGSVVPFDRTGTEG